MAFSLKLFVFASLCIYTVLSYDCNQEGLQQGFASGLSFSLDCSNPPIVYLTQTLMINTNFSWQMNGVILRSNDTGVKYGLQFSSSTFSISSGVIEVPVSISNSVATFTSVNIRNFTASGSFTSSISSVNSRVNFLRSSTFATAGAQGTLYVNGGTFNCLQSSLISNSAVNITGASFNYENINETSTYDSCSIKGASLSLMNSNYANFSFFATKNTIWDVPTATYASTFFGDYNVFQSSVEINGAGNTYEAKNIFEAPIESPSNYIGRPSYDCPFATAWIPLAACSPALDVAPTSSFSTDQNGSPRVQNGAVDAGAIESYLKPCLNAQYAISITQCFNSVSITLILSSKSANNVSVVYSTQDATAIAGTDYVPAAGKATFPQGATRITISVLLIPKSNYTLEKRIFRVVYSNAAYSNLKDQSTAIQLTCRPPVTTGAITSSAISTASVTSASITSARLTTHAMTTSQMTTNQMTTVRPLTTSVFTTASFTSSEMTTSPITTSPITSGKGLTTQWMTTGKINTPVTTAAVRLTTGYTAGTPNSTTDCDALTLICKLGDCAPSTFTVDGSVYNYDDFNVITFGDFNIAIGDVAGRVLVGGSFYAQNEGISIGSKLSNNSFPYSVIVGGNAVFVNGEVYPRGSPIFVGSNFTGPDYIRARIKGYCPTTGCLNDELSKVENYFVNASKTLAALPDTATAVLNGQQLNVTCNKSAKLQIISINATTFSIITDYLLKNCDPTSLFLINIRGSSSVVFQGSAFDSPSVVFNVLESTRVYVNATVSGSILAPVSTYTQTAGYVEGQVVTASNAATVQIVMPRCSNASVPISINDDFVASESDASKTVFSIVFAVIMSLAIML